VDKLSGPLDRLVHGLQFFIRLTEVGRATVLVKATINHDFLFEAAAKIVSINRFCPPQLKFCVVVFINELAATKNSMVFLDTRRLFIHLS
jgi:hypothetical protein